MSDMLHAMTTYRKAGISAGIASYCTANELVIEACFQQAMRFHDDVLIEATANQVNQFGGYTGMRPADFRDFVYRIAQNVGFPQDKIILGGDHLGPLTWQKETEESAMAKSVELVKLFVGAGFKKIHLDTSMRVADDDVSVPLSDETIAHRGVTLYKACEEAYQEMLAKNPNEVRPVYVVGSEVPIPGGSQEEEESISVTKPEAMARTIEVYQKAFEEAGLADAFAHIIGIVVQPGVEFGDADFFRYDRHNAKELVAAANAIDGIVLEGHSTDYQPAQALREMVEDGIAILKVGPALTFALREGLFALSHIEKELVHADQRANFVELLEEIMLRAPEQWQKHYHGTEEQLQLKRKYSFSDRSRYYFALPEIEAAMAKLFDNLDGVEIPMSMLRQFMPLQYYKVRDGKLPLKARELAKDNVVALVEDYNYATHFNYMISNLFMN